MSICEYNTDAYLNGEASPVKLATIYDDSRMYTYFNVASGQHLPQLPDSISIDQTDGQRSYAARLNYVSPDIDLGTGTLLLRADMDNDDHQLKSGQYVGVTLPYEDVHDAVLIGSASVGTDQAGSYIYVVDHDNTVRMRRIETGQTVDDTLRVVTAGLKPGERYVTKALLKVRDGMHINPINSTDKR
jgi:RND family efflux transporter MFP subunit